MMEPITIFLTIFFVVSTFDAALNQPNEDESITQPVHSEIASEVDTTDQCRYLPGPIVERDLSRWRYEHKDDELDSSTTENKTDPAFQEQPPLVDDAPSSKHLDNPYLEDSDS